MKPKNKIKNKVFKMTNKKDCRDDRVLKSAVSLLQPFMP